MKIFPRHIIYLSSLLLLGFAVASCDEQNFFGKDDKEHVTDINEIPLTDAEKMSLYQNLSAYIPQGFLFGNGIDMINYVENAKGKYKSLVNNNFNSVTVGYHMKHGAMVRDDGSIVYTSVDNFLSMLPDSIELYGHTLMWHSNQNASYLNSLIADKQEPENGSNLIPNGGFENGLSCWTIPYNEQKFSINTVSADVKSGSKSLKADVGTTDGTEGNVTIQSPKFAVIQGHRYVLTFYLKADVAGQKIGFNFSSGSLGNQYPWLNGADDGKIITTTTWRKFTFDSTTVNGTGMMTAVANDSMTFNLNLGVAQNTVCYFDDFVFIDLDATPSTHTNLISNPDFERDDLPGDNYFQLGDWNAYGDNNPERARVSTDYYGGNFAMQITNPISSDNYKAQAVIPATFIDGHEYHAEVWIKSSVANAKAQMFVQNDSYSDAQYGNNETVETAWTKIEWDFTASVTPVRFGFQLGEVAASYYIDDVLVYDKTAEAALIRSFKVAASKKIIAPRAMSDSEKSAIIDTAFKTWISGMMGQYKHRVTAWDVVNEAIADNGEIRTAANSGTLSSDNFFWQDYLGGKDAFVKAFAYARQYGNGTSDKLFLNDYGLESNTAKLNAFIELASYIESQGQTIDGLGTQMHIQIDSDTAKIDAMFSAMAATGKLIKVSELDVATGSATPSPNQLAQQAKMFKYVIDSYKRHVPESQRHGITLWGMADGDSNWLKNQAACMWDSKYERKAAYKGVADGLAGRDIGADFTSEDLLESKK